MDVIKKWLRKFPKLERFARRTYLFFRQAFRKKEDRTGVYDLPDFRRLSLAAGDETAPDGLPVPSPEMRHWVAGTDDLEWFLEGGQLGEKTIQNLLASQGLSLVDLDNVLDFGCGCGRVIRFLEKYATTQLHGSDINLASVYWCDQNLDFAEFSSNHLAPPLRYRNNSFDLIYAFSVFTHLSGEMQRAWMDEMRRVLRPQGFLLVTLHGEYHIRELNPAQKNAFQNGEMIIVSENLEGHNVCASFHPESYVRKTFSDGFRVLKYAPEGALGNPRQDAYLLQKV